MGPGVSWLESTSSGRREPQSAAYLASCDIIQIWYINILHKSDICLSVALDDALHTVFSTSFLGSGIARTIARLCKAVDEIVLLALNLVKWPNTVDLGGAGRRDSARDVEVPHAARKFLLPERASSAQEGRPLDARFDGLSCARSQKGIRSGSRGPRRDFILLVCVFGIVSRGACCCDPPRNSRSRRFAGLLLEFFEVLKI